MIIIDPNITAGSNAYETFLLKGRGLRAPGVNPPVSPDRNESYTKPWQFITPDYLRPSRNGKYPFRRILLSAPTIPVHELLNTRVGGITKRKHRLFLDARRMYALVTPDQSTVEPTLWKKPAQYWNGRDIGTSFYPV
jgi:hypothetical protein